jgi:hypothetical protein
MEKLNDIIISEYNSHSLLTSCLYIDKYDIMACGDNQGRILIFDQRVQKPFVQLIISDNKSEISNIQYSNDNDELFFSCEDTIYSCDNITNSYTKKILSKNCIKTDIINENEDGEITDFLLLPNNTIVYPEQEQETFLFYSLIEEPKNKDDKDEDDNMLPYQEIDKFFLSSAYGEEYISSIKKVLLYSFDGEIFLYDYKTKQTSNNIQIKKYLDNADINSISNPPYLNKVILNKDNNEMKRNKSSLQKMFTENPLKNDRKFNERTQKLKIYKTFKEKGNNNYNFISPMRFDIEYHNKYEGIGMSINRDSNIRQRTQNVIFYNIKVNENIKTLKYIEGDDLKLNVINFVKKNKLPEEVTDIILTKIKEKTIEETF